MQCPRCNVPMTMSDRQGVEIDYCPQCRGVWLDRGELDKIVEREASFAAPSAPAVQGAPPYSPERTRFEPDRGRYDRDDDDDDRRYGRPDGRPDGRRKRGWLGELFDFD